MKKSRGWVVPFVTKERKPLQPEVEREVVRMSKSGDSRSYEPLVRAYEGPGLRLAIGMLGSVDEATDALQDAFIKAWQSLHRFDITRPFGPWFFQILRNQCRDVIRSRQSRERHEVRDDLIEIRPAGASSDPARRHERGEASMILWRALDALADEHREILVLKELQGFRYSEISEILRIPEGTVASRLYHARDALREALCATSAEYP